MAGTPESKEISSAGYSRVVLICPDCGHENVAVVERLRAAGQYPCGGEGCGYRFDLGGGSRRSLVQGFTETWRKFYAALTPAD